MARPRLIDDGQMISLYKQGKSLADIGRELNVSSVAIHKRIKRLALSRVPESLSKLTDKARNFALAVASGQSRTAAVMQTYDVTSRDSAKALQTSLMKDPEIRTAIDELMETKGIGKAYRVDKLKQHLDNPDPVISLKSLDMAFKLSGDEQEAKRNNVPVKDSFSFIDLTPCRYVPGVDIIKGKCSICLTEIETDNFCNTCLSKYPELIEKILRYWNGDVCAGCTDDKRSFSFCNACTRRADNDV